MPPLTKNKKELLAAIKNFDEPEALKKVLDSRQEELNFALEQTLERVEMPRKRKLQIFDALMEAGADPNMVISKRMLKTNQIYMEEPLLVWAFNERDFKILFRLLANPKADLDVEDEKGATLLHNVQETGSAELTKELLERGASANVFDPSGMIPLFHAIREENWGSVQMLLPKSDLSTKDDDGENALHYALRFKRWRPKRLLEHLIKGGAEVDERALEIARQYEDEEVIRLLTEASQVNEDSD